MSDHISILHLNSGNIGSVAAAFKEIGAEVNVICTKTEVENAERIVLPGIGHFGNAMNQLLELDLIDSLRSHILNNKPFLGICLGMQLLAQESEEGNATGLGIFDATVNKLKVENTLRYKIPHNGWNTIQIKKENFLLSGISELDEFFFLHKYAWNSSDKSEIQATAYYEQEFPSVVGSNKCWGVQFHPEKSHEAGRKLLSNFLKL